MPTIIDFMALVGGVYTACDVILHDVTSNVTNVGYATPIHECRASISLEIFFLGGTS